MSRSPDVPAYAPDLYSPQAILDPHPHYAMLRELGPVVWLPKHKVYALPRYAECKAVLLDVIRRLQRLPPEHIAGARAAVNACPVAALTADLSID